MEKLTNLERELVALGAALGSNCVPCIEYHIPQARNAGLDDQQIREAIDLADKVRQVPARKVLDAARGLLAPAGPAADTDKTAAAGNSAPGCAQMAQKFAGGHSCCG